MFWLSVQALPATSDPVLNFSLLDHRGRLQELRRQESRVIVLFFTANDCPVARQCASKLRALQEKYAASGVRVWLVNSAGDERGTLEKAAFELGLWHLPTLHDDTQGVARMLGVKRTGETIAIGTRDWVPFYRGAIDDQLVEGAQKPQPTERFLEVALDEFLAGRPVANSRTTSRGCLLHFDAGEVPDESPVSYSSEVAPILVAKCIGCHSPGNIGAGAMTGYRKVKNMSDMIEEVLLTRRMPPWDADPHFGKFVGNPSLSLAQSRTLLRWIHQGAPRGEGADPLESANPQPAAEWPLGVPDLVVRLPETQQIPATGVLEYRHLAVIATNAEPAWVGAVYVRPGNRKVLHHIIGRLKEGGRKDHLGEAELFVGWAPGSTQTWLPEGSGKYLPAHAKFDLELHYTTTGSPQTDETEIGIYFRRQPVTRRYESVPVVNAKFEIRPGDSDSATEALYCFQKEALLHGVTPHMHLRGRWMKFEILYPNGRRETVASVPRYDFNWQLSYTLVEPKRLPAGTWVRLSGGFDNSPRNPANPDPQKTVFWGEQSWDEMFLGWYNVTWPLDDGPVSTTRESASIPGTPSPAQP
jgi:peroxiredoxin